MAKSLRNKLANMALCCTVVTGTVGQVAPVFAQGEAGTVVKNEISTETTTGSGVEVVDKNEVVDEEVIEEVVTTENAGVEVITNEETPGDVAKASSSVQDPWEDEKVNATHFGAIKVYKADQDTASMAAQFFTKESLPIEIVDGKVVLKLQVSKDGMGVQNAITSLEQKVGENTYEALTLKYANDVDVRYVVTEIDFENIEEPVVLRCGINAGFMTMTQELRILLTDETIAYIKAQTTINTSISSTDETAFEAADGTITINATGGSGNYEYTIDGGKSWSTSNTFTNLEAKKYSVAVRDAANTGNISAFKEVVIAARAEFSVGIEVLHETEDKPSHAASFFKKENVALTFRDGKAYLQLQVDKDGMGAKDVIRALALKVGDEYKDLELQYLDDENVRYVVTEVPLSTVNEELYINTNVVVVTDKFNMDKTYALRIRLTEESAKDILKVAPQLNPVAMTVVEDNGTIKITAENGSGNYEYTIDGGKSWSESNVFTGLLPGTYSVAVRDAKNTANVTAFETVEVDNEYLVDIEVLHETEDKPSHAASFFKQDSVALTIKNGKAYLTLQVNKDGMGAKDVIKELALKVGDKYENLELQYLDDENVRYVVTEVPLSSASEELFISTRVVVVTDKFDMDKTYTLRVKLTDDSANSMHEILGQLQGEVITPVTVTEVEKVDSTGTIKVTANGGSGTYEYTIDGGVNWQSTNSFTGLAAGTYQVGVRDAQNTTNVSAFQAVEIVATGNTDHEGIQDGYYSIDIKVLHETQDTSSMASGFFNKTGLPLRIQDGKAYLTIQVLKDGMGMTDVITSLEQRIDGAYKLLYLNYKNDSSKRYVTAEVQFDSLDDVAYLRCGIAPMQGMNPVLRIKLDKGSLQEGAGSIDTSFSADEAATINKVEAENGKVKVYLNAANEELTANDFTGKIYLNDDTKGSDLKLKDFKMENEVITFTYDAVEVAEKDQTVTVGITLNEKETKSNTFTVKGLLSESKNAKISLKENAHEIKYIKGYEDGTFKPNSKVTKAEALSMLSLLVDSVENEYYTANISILHATKDETSMAGQFFKNAGVSVKKQDGRYFIELEIANEGLGFTDIITGVEQKIGESYKALEVRKTADMKKAYVTLEVASLEDAVVLKTGIAPMGSVAPELRIVVDTKSLEESKFESGFTDIDMWAKDAITLFEEAGVIGENGEETFNPNENITRAEFIKIIAQVAGLEIAEDYVHEFKDLEGHVFEGYINAAAEAGYIHGYGDNTFKPEGTLTRAEAVKVINKLVGHTEETNVDVENPFKDLISNHWAYDEILKVAER